MGIYLFYLSILSLSVCLSVCLSVSLSLRPSVCLPVCLPVCLCFCCVLVSVSVLCVGPLCRSSVSVLCVGPLCRSFGGEPQGAPGGPRGLQGSENITNHWFYSIKGAKACVLLCLETEEL